MHQILVNPAGFARASELRALGVPFAVSTIWQKVAKGEFPAPSKLSVAVTAWRISDVLAWLEQQASQAPTASNRGARLTAARQAKRRQQTTPQELSNDKAKEGR